MSFLIKKKKKENDTKTADVQENPALLKSLEALTSHFLFLISLYVKNKNTRKALKQACKRRWTLGNKKKRPFNI